jgi:hypothetical protein
VATARGRAGSPITYCPRFAGMLGGRSDPSQKPSGIRCSAVTRLVACRGCGILVSPGPRCARCRRASEKAYDEARPAFHALYRTQAKASLPVPSHVHLDTAVAALVEDG